MPSKKLKAEEIIGKLHEFLIMISQGGAIAEACRRIAVSEQTYYRWHGGLGAEDGLGPPNEGSGQRNVRLRRATSGLTLDELI